MIDQKHMALIAIAVVIPLAKFWVAYSGGLLSTTPATQNISAQSSNSHNSVQVIASIYPLYDFAKQVGGNRVNATTMVPIRIEPHDWEPSAKQVIDLQSAVLFVYNGAGIDS